jgi:hypothetical protein
VNHGASSRKWRMVFIWMGVCSETNLIPSEMTIELAQSCVFWASTGPQMKKLSDPACCMAAGRLFVLGASHRVQSDRR